MIGQDDDNDDDDDDDASDVDADTLTVVSAALIGGCYHTHG